MTATIRPSLILNMDVDERQFSDDVVAEIKRSYSYVAPSVVAAVPASADVPIENTLRLVVRMHRPYWDAVTTRRPGSSGRLSCRSGSPTCSAKVSLHGDGLQRRAAARLARSRCPTRGWKWNSATT
ncbi:MAG: hypothetical protein ACLTDR_04480 [Adlercreutzia equolifaciens]